MGPAAGPRQAIAGARQTGPRLFFARETKVFVGRAELRHGNP
jgi:hypothetical protein